MNAAAGGDPGELIRAEPMKAYLSPGVRLRARATRILYRSTSATGEPTVVSGTVLVPPGSLDGPRPLVGYAVGTHGMGDAAAPSRLLARGLDYEAGPIALVLARGCAVAVSDYQGLGTPGDHTYLVGRALGPNVLDAMRAARELHPGELPAGGPAAIIGYSERGVAAAWAAQLTDPNVLELPDWRARLRENRLGGIAPEAPVLLHHARRDPVVSYVQSLDLRDDWRALGGDVRLHTIRGAVDHVSAGMLGAPVALRWLARRLREDGRATPLERFVPPPTEEELLDELSA